MSAAVLLLLLTSEDNAELRGAVERVESCLVL